MPSVTREGDTAQNRIQLLQAFGHLIISRSAT